MNRPSIPDAIARSLRQEAGFGCCDCGNPILQYHHIIGWNVERHFRKEDMMVLCPLHHDKATKGAMSIEEQRSLKLNPININRGHVKGLLAVKQDYCAADLGSILIVGDGIALRIGGKDVIGLYIGQGNLEISLQLFSKEDKLLLHIEKNEWISGDALPWDLEFDWQKLTLRERSRHINLSLNAKERPLLINGHLYASGREVTIDGDGVLLDENVRVSVILHL